MLKETELNKEIKSLFDNILFSSEPKGLYDPLAYTIALGGKRLRPQLCLLCYSIYKDKLDESILSPATGLEVFHSFTLIHDDIMDKSPLRRGQETIWKKWDSDTAILSGDVMCIDSFKRVSKAPNEVLDKVLSLFCQTTAQVCEGQQYDKEFESKDEVSLEQYLNMIGLKTAVLLACSAKMGAIIGGAKEEECQALYDYAYNMGLAFQIADDYLDCYGNEKIFGKPIGGDIVHNKKSWLTIQALQKAKGETLNRLSSAMRLGIESEEDRMKKISIIKDIYKHLDIAKEAQEEIIKLTQKAKDIVQKVYSDDIALELCRFADKLIGRTK